MREISKIALQACIMNNPMNLHAVESRLLDIQKIRETVSSKPRFALCMSFQRDACHDRNLGRYKTVH